MSSVRKEEKRVAKRRQVYKPILDNPFTNEGKLWPHVTDQNLVFQLLEEKVLKRWKLLQEVGKDDACVTVGFNEIVGLLSPRDTETPSDARDEYLLFVCTKDLPSVLISQIPILCEISRLTVKLVQLPRFSLARFEDAFKDVKHNGMCLVRADDHYKNFARLIADKVESLSIPWLHSAEFQRAPVKLVATTAPILKKTAASDAKKPQKQQQQQQQQQRSS
ncbi:unnamed protein product [Kluyveromyces dobzhanskii CBS 2104]|uniref:WGS project CCBQ000000000 data, contig 00015 n=1 Tax=Kluyveromyces dobzhanskii CBS 2104 TaxID=1427455 RepID=A0A0A8LB20_9SACH|nr:unnamed protein product [Kluyveromyces dobzhanskii CBS 2104]